MPRWTKLLDTLINKALVPIVTSVLAIFVYQLDSTVKTLDVELKAREATRLENSDYRDMRFKIYEAVTKSLESQEKTRQLVAQALVVSMLDTNDTLRIGLLAVLGSQATEEVKVVASKALDESRRFEAASQSLGTGRSGGSDWRSYNVDVFWCSASGKSAETTAGKVETTLRDAGASGRLRIRELPASINAAPGYQISGLMIRSEVAESEAAEAMRATLTKPLGDFAVTRSRMLTPGYLSVFVCQ